MRCKGSLRLRAETTARRGLCQSGEGDKQSGVRTSGRLHVDPLCVMNSSPCAPVCIAVACAGVAVCSLCMRVRYCVESRSAAEPQMPHADSQITGNSAAMAGTQSALGALHPHVPRWAAQKIFLPFNGH